jgi:methyltransferase (TIGR00027 family)
MLASELPGDEALMRDPFAYLVADGAATAAARADASLQRSIRLRTRYIDDAVLAFASLHPRPQIVLLGAGYDARAYRLDISATVYEIDFPATLAHKAALMAHIAPINTRIAVPVDLASASFVEPLHAAGFDPILPVIVVWEGVSFYLSTRAATSVVVEVGAISAPGSVFVADYAEVARAGTQGFGNATDAMAAQLGDGGEPLRSGLSDMRSTLDAAGFEVVDDELIELLSPRYGQPIGIRQYHSRIVTARRR